MVANFVDRSWQLAGEQEREQYLSRLTATLSRARWRLLGYALMSSHVHILTQAGDTPLAAWAKPLHVGMAQWLNRRCGRLGPVFADRPYCELVAPDAVAIVLAYLHNNPVRARVAARAVDSTWTSHRAYVGIDSEPAGLDVEHGLEVTGFSRDPVGLAEFDAWVQACAEAQIVGVTSRGDLAQLLSGCRQRLGSSVSLGTPKRDTARCTFPLLVSPDSAVRVPIDCTPNEIIDAVTAASGVCPRELSRRRPRGLSRARRATLLLWSQTGRPRSVMVRALGIGSSAAAVLSRTTSENDVALAAVVAKVRHILDLPP